MKKISFLIFLFILSLLYFTTQKKNITKISLKIDRFESELFSLNHENLNNDLAEIEKNFQSVNEIFASQILLQNNIKDSNYGKEILRFINHPDMREAYDSVSLVFSDISDISEDLSTGFSYFNYFLPNYPLPQITTFFSGFNYGVISFENNVLIGLENFLGANSKFYQYLQEPLYLRRQKQKQFIPINVMEVWLNEHFHHTLISNDFISQMIYKGKVMYCIDNMFPDIEMKDKFRYTEEQMLWAIENESNIWAYFLDNEILFSSNEQEFRSFLTHAPFAKGMPQEAPARVAYFIGYKIINNLMKNNKMDFETMMNIREARSILRKSNYKPSK